MDRHVYISQSYNGIIALSIDNPQSGFAFRLADYSVEEIIEYCLLNRSAWISYKHVAPIVMACNDHEIFREQLGLDKTGDFCYTKV